MKNMDHSFRTGLCFGMTSGVITTLGLMVGLHSGTGSQLAVIGGILTIAIADAASDALGIHISEEAENVHTHREIWTSTVATFLSKLVFALTFIVPVLLFDLTTAIWIGVAWGMAVLSFVSYRLARTDNVPPGKVILEHLVIAIAVITATHYLGDWIAQRFA
jgi:VIT1/CCC1 family predicted Fe2+/Mn2+ transporter